MVIEGVVPLAIKAGNQIEFSNNRKYELDEDYLERNIDKMPIEANLSPKQIDIFKAIQRKKIKKGKWAIATTMHTRSFKKNKS